MHVYNFQTVVAAISNNTGEFDYLIPLIIINIINFSNLTLYILYINYNSLITSFLYIQDMIDKATKIGPKL